MTEVIIGKTKKINFSENSKSSKEISVGENNTTISATGFGAMISSTDSLYSNPYEFIREGFLSPLTFTWKQKSSVCLEDCNFWCGLLCCLCCYIPYPPLPYRIVPKFAFAPPPRGYELIRTGKQKNRANIYKFDSNQKSLVFGNINTIDKDIFPNHKFYLEYLYATDRLNAYLIHPSHTNRLGCYYLNYSNCFNSPYVVLRCHSNGSDISFELHVDHYFSERLRCDVFSFDYCGYGVSSGTPTESNMYEDVTAAYRFLTDELLIDPQRIVVYGQSIGTVAAIHLASIGVPIKGLILEGVVMSMCRIVYPTMENGVVKGDSFQSASKVPLIKYPTLVIHGCQDNITTIEHAEYFMELCTSLVPPLFIPDGSHLDASLYKAYWHRLQIFFEQELGNGYVTNDERCGYLCKEDH